MHLREARAIEADKWSIKLGVLTNALLSAFASSEAREELPALSEWYKVFPPQSAFYSGRTGEQARESEAAELPPEFIGAMLDGFFLRAIEDAKRRRGKHA